jgi:hypothetical protein
METHSSTAHHSPPPETARPTNHVVAQQPAQPYLPGPNSIGVPDERTQHTLFPAQRYPRHDDICQPRHPGGLPHMPNSNVSDLSLVSDTMNPVLRSTSLYMLYSILHTARQACTVEASLGFSSRLSRHVSNLRLCSGFRSCLWSP